MTLQLIIFAISIIALFFHKRFREKLWKNAKGFIRPFYDVK